MESYPGHTQAEMYDPDEERAKMRWSADPRGSDAGALALLWGPIFGFIRLVLGLLFLPIWLPILSWKTIAAKRRRVDFVDHCLAADITEHSQIISKWFEAHPYKSPSEASKVHDSLRKIIASRSRG